MNTAPKLGREVMAVIGRELRRMYADIIAQGVPDHFAANLRGLDQAIDKSTPPAARSTSSEYARRNDQVRNGGDTRECRALTLCPGLALAALMLAFRFARRNTPIGRVPIHQARKGLMAARRSK